MTDLEKLWDDLPTGPAPVDHLIRAGRRRTGRRKRLIVRPLIMTGSVAALLATFVAGTHVGGGSGPGTPPAIDARPASFQADLDPAASCQELLTSYRDRGLAQVTAWGWRADYEPYSDSFNSLSGEVRQEFRATATKAVGSSDTGTNVQEPGVDEPDTVKTDGARVVRLRGSTLTVHGATAAGMQKISSLHLPRLDDGELLLDGDAVIALGADRTSERDEFTGLRRGSRVITISLKDADKPAITSDVTYSARIISARQHGSIARLVLSSGLPALDFTHPNGRKVTSRQALAANREAVTTSTITDWLPTYDDATGPRPLLDCTNVAIPSEDLGLDTVSIVGINTKKPTAPSAIGLAGATTIAYESADHLYLAPSPTMGSCGMLGSCKMSTDGTTHVFDFELDGIQARHIASGEIEGSIADRWSLDEADDVLRVAVGPSSVTGNFNSIVTMKRVGTELVELGRLDHLGPGEDLKGVRWFDDLAIVVTFREVDPLFTVDLADPAKPTLLGKLKIPGYSDYLHPIGHDQLLGIGYNGSGSSAQIALFDIADLSAVRRDDVQTFTRYSAMATEDPRAFTWLPDRRTALTVLQKGRSVYLATITVRGGQLHNRLERVEYGDDASNVRTVPLSDGRVALITRQDVRLLALP